MILKTQFSIFCNDFPLLFYPQLPKKLALRFPLIYIYIYIHIRLSMRLREKSKENLTI